MATTLSFCFVRILVGSGCLNRASLSTCAALDALVCVDLELAVALSDCANGASIYTCTASDASVCNLVCHN